MDFETIKTTALWILVGVIVIAIVLAIIIRKVIGKVITLVVAAVLVFFGWQQRAAIIDYADGAAATATESYCSASPSFFGIQVTLPGC